jgi:hypothetical protein
MSESAASKEAFEPFCKGLGIEMGFGGFKSVDGPLALTMDMPVPYTSVGGDKQVLRGSAENLSGFCDETLSWINSSHLLEDWTYSDLVEILKEWRRVLVKGGYICTNCPDQQRFLSYIAKHNQGNNLAHKSADFSLQTFKERVVEPTGPWEIVYEMPDDGKYSWYLVIRKI